MALDAGTGCTARRHPHGGDVGPSGKPALARGTRPDPRCQDGTATPARAYRRLGRARGTAHGHRPRRADPGSRFGVAVAAAASTAPRRRRVGDVSADHRGQYGDLFCADNLPGRRSVVGGDIHPGHGGRGLGKFRDYDPVYWADRPRGTPAAARVEPRRHYDLPAHPVGRLPCRRVRAPRLGRGGIGRSLHRLFRDRPRAGILAADRGDLALRGRAMSLAAVANWSFNLLVSATFLDMAAALGSAGAFLIYAILSILALGFVVLLVPETKGRTLEQIEADAHLTPAPANNVAGKARSV